MAITNIQLLGIDFESKILSTITDFFKRFNKSGAYNLKSFENKTVAIARNSLKQFRHALADSIYETYNVKDVKKFIANKDIKTIFTNAEKELTKSITYATQYANNFASSLVLKNEKEAIGLINSLYNSGLKANPKYALEGAVGFIDSETEFKTNFLKEKEDKPGSFLVYIPRTFSACPICVNWQGKVLIDDVYRNGLDDGIHETLSAAMENGLFHPNCRDTFIRVESDNDEEIKKLKESGKEPKQYRKHELNKRYEAEQRQRQLAKQARNWKRKVQDGVDKLGMPQSAKEKESTIREVAFASGRIKEKYAEVNELRKDGYLLRVNYRMFQTEYEYRSRRDWDFNSLRNRAS